MYGVFSPCCEVTLGFRLMSVRLPSANCRPYTYVQWCSLNAFPRLAAQHRVSMRLFFYSQHSARPDIVDSEGGPHFNDRHYT